MENTPTDNAARNAIYLKFMGQSKDSQVFINIHFLCQHQERQTTPTCSQGRAERGPRERGPWHSAPSRRETGRSRGRREHTECNSALTRATRTHLSRGLVLLSQLPFSRGRPAHPNSKCPPGSWKLPAPNDPFLFPRRTQPGCSQLVTTTPTPTPGRRLGSVLALIALGCPRK